MAGRTKRPGPSRSEATRGRARNLAAGSPPPTGVGGEVHPSGDPTRPVWVQLHLFVVVYVVAGRPEPVPEPEPEPEDPGHQLTLPGFPEPKTPEDHLAAMRAELERPRTKTKRPA